jgi:hypothetical protein
MSEEIILLINVITIGISCLTIGFIFGRLMK